MVVFLNLCWMFMIGCLLGYGVEVVFRRVFSAKKWMNPGFLYGPWLPLYGFGLMALYIFSSIDLHMENKNLQDVVLCLIMGVIMTVVEYLAGIIFIKGFKVKLWDYSRMKGNIQGIICPLFSLIWTAVSFLYYYCLHSFFVQALNFFNENIFYIEFWLGLLYGIMLIDFCLSTQAFAKLYKFSKNSKVIISYEQYKITKRNNQKQREAEFNSKHPEVKDFFDQAATRAQEMVGHIIYKEYASSNIKKQKEDCKNDENHSESNQKQ